MFSKYGKFTKNNSSKSDNFGAFFSQKNPLYKSDWIFLSPSDKNLPK
jgi:hypothetical protein